MIENTIELPLTLDFSQSLDERIGKVIIDTRYTDYLANGFVLSPAVIVKDGRIEIVALGLTNRPARPKTAIVPAPCATQEQILSLWKAIAVTAIVMCLGFGVFAYRLIYG